MRLLRFWSLQQSTQNLLMRLIRVLRFVFFGTKIRTGKLLRFYSDNLRYAPLKGQTTDCWSQFRNVKLRGCPHPARSLHIMHIIPSWKDCLWSLCYTSCREGLICKILCSLGDLRELTLLGLKLMRFLNRSVFLSSGY